MPSLRQTTTSSYVRNPMSLWIEIHLAYNTATSSNPVRTSVLDEVWGYIRWCRDEYKNDDMSTAVTVGFFEHLLDTRAVRDDLPHRISIKEAEGSVIFATYFHSQDDVERYLEWFSGTKRTPPGQPFRLNNTA